MSLSTYVAKLDSYPIPLSPMQNTKVSIKTDKMPSNTSGATAEMYHLDSRYLIAMLLSIKNGIKKLFSAPHASSNTRIIAVA